MRQLAAIALSSWRQFSRDRIFYLTFFVAALLIGFSYLLATLTIAESRKILLDFGFSFLSIAGVAIAIFLGVAAVAKEIENRVVYTILSKPVSRVTYLFGKFLGAFAVLAVAQLLLSLTLALIVGMARESLPAGFWPCCLLILFENVILLAVAFLGAIYFSSLIAAGITFSFFLVGRSSTSLETMMAKASSPEIKALAAVLYYAFPNLERFNLRDVVAYGQPYPLEMLPNGILYALAYVAVCLGLAFAFFRRRDIP
jgi:ABC-type transport system involved in multi-copper enzyme maturation permease subunit